MRLFVNGGRLEQEFIIAPHADLSLIKMRHEGVQSFTVEDNGEAVVRTTFGEMRENAPRIFQRIAENTIEVSGRFVQINDDEYGFEVSDYAADYPLTIDPTLIYATFLGGTGGENGQPFYGSKIAVDEQGNAFVTGDTNSQDFPLVNSPRPIFQSSAAFLAKFNPLAPDAYFITLFGSPRAAYGGSLALDGGGNVYVTGWSFAGFPIVNGYDSGTQFGPFVAVFATGDTVQRLTYSSLFGDDPDSGSMRPHAIAADTRGNAYIVGETRSATNIKATNGFASYAGGGFDGTDAFLVRFNTNLAGAQSLVYSTYFGSSGDDYGYGLAIDNQGHC